MCLFSTRIYYYTKYSLSTRTLAKEYFLCMYTSLDPQSYFSTASQAYWLCVNKFKQSSKHYPALFTTDGLARAIKYLRSRMELKRPYLTTVVLSLHVATAPHISSQFFFIQSWSQPTDPHSARWIIKLRAPPFCYSLLRCFTSFLPLSAACVTYCFPFRFRHQRYLFFSKSLLRNELWIIITHCAFRFFIHSI